MFKLRDKQIALSLINWTKFCLPFTIVSTLTDKIHLKTLRLEFKWTKSKEINYMIKLEIYYTFYMTSSSLINMIFTMNQVFFLRKREKA